jgi:hypothetical protein
MESLELGTWEWGAADIILLHEMDVTSLKTRAEFGPLFDQGMIVAIGQCAWAELKRLNVPWTLMDQVKLMAGKQHDYGHGNIAKFGQMGVLVRLWDKIARYNNLVRRNADAVNESLQDTLIDMIGYVVIHQMLALGTFMFPLEADKEPF